MGGVQFRVPLRLCRMLKDELGLRSAIETGTYLGDSAAALGGVFDEVWSIELSEEFFEAARMSHARPGLHFVQGRSEQVLPDLLRGVDGPALFWLDGHWSAGETAGEELECPVMHELAAIDAWPAAKDSAVLIDDARYFLGPPPPPHEPSAWPTFLEVLDALRRDYDRFVTVLEDVIIAGPTSTQPLVGRYWLERPVEPEADEPVPLAAPSSTPTELRGARRARSWARAAWVDLPPRETLRRAARHVPTMRPWRA